MKGMGAFGPTATQILERHGIKSPEAQGWYSQQAWLDAFREIAQSIGPRTLNRIGTSIPNSAKFPPGLDTMDKALASIDVAYHMNHRGGEIGHYKFQKTGERKVCWNAAILIPAISIVGLWRSWRSSLPRRAQRPSRTTRRSCAARSRAIPALS